MTTTATGAEKEIGDIAAHGLKAVLIGHGFDLGLFQALKELNGLCTSESLAEKANLNERYVREWLGSMVAADIMLVDEGQQYSIQQDTLDAILSKGPWWSFITLFGIKRPDIKQCFKSLKPTGYTMAEFPEIWEFTNAAHKGKYTSKWVAENFDPVFDKLPNKADVLDLGCGTGILANALAEKYPNAFVTGADVCESVIEDCVRTYSSPNLSFVTTDGTVPDDWTNRFDLVIMADALHDVPNPSAILKDVQRILKPNALFVSFDPPIHSSHAQNKGSNMGVFCYFGSIMNCLPNSMVAPPYIGYGAGWGYEAKVKMLEESGFQMVYMTPEEEKEKDVPRNRVVCMKKEK